MMIPQHRWSKRWLTNESKKLSNVIFKSGKNFNKSILVRCSAVTMQVRHVLRQHIKKYTTKSKEQKNSFLETIK